MNLVPYVAGQTEDPPHHMLYCRWMYNKAVRRGEWKLVVTEDGSPSVPEGEQRVKLYNLRLDPAETTNLEPEYPVLAAELLCGLSTWEAELAAPLWPPVMHFWLDVHGRRWWFAI